MRWALALALAAGTVPVMAQAGDKTQAVTMRHQLRVNPDDAMTMANLARHYVRTGQPQRAERLYRGLLALDDVQLERGAGSAVSSHWLAAQAMRGLARPRTVQLSSRP